MLGHTRRDWKKVEEYKGLVIAMKYVGEIAVFNKTEWSYGKGLRYSRFDCESIEEAKETIDSM